MTVDETRCVRCGTCASVCPNQVFGWRGEQLEIRYPGRCIQCGHCQAVCPEDAFHHEGIRRSFSPVDVVSAVSPEALQGLMVRRRSCRRFLDRSVSNDDLSSLLDAAARAPTATNSQNVRFIALDHAEQIQRLSDGTVRYYLRLAKRMENPLIRLILRLTVGKKLVDNYRFHLPAIASRFLAVEKGEASLFYGAPLVLIAVASGLVPLAAANANLAVMQMMLKAETLGLGTVYNGYSLTALQRDKVVRRTMGIADGYLPSAVLAVGYPDIVFYKSPPRRRARVIKPFD